MIKKKRKNQTNDSYADGKLSKENNLSLKVNAAYKH